MEASPFLATLQEQHGVLTMPLSPIRIEHPFKQGTLSESYLVHHDGLDLPCVLRVMKPVIRDQLGQEVQDSLLRMCQQYASIRHPVLSTLYDLGEHAGHAYALIEYVSGVPLTERVEQRPLSDCEALKLMAPIADGLAALWRSNYIHRGVSPLRILITGDGTPKLDMVVLPRVAMNSVLIEAHAPFMAGYWPPEELRQSLNIDARSDMFSFGATLYYAVTGQSPFGKGSKTELIARTMADPPVPPQELNPNLCPDFCNFLIRCLQRNPADRFTSTQEFLDALTAVKTQLCRPAAPRPSSFGPLVESPATATQAAFRDGDIIGQCKLEKMVGRGAFGVVFQARHQLLDIPVAVKFLPVELAAQNPEYVDLFLREARTAIRIRHKNVIGLYEAGVQNGQYYLIMEFAPGGSAQDRADLLGGVLPVDEVVRLMKDAAAGLSAAEEMNIIHRDIKPANLMYGSQQEIKIADLGLAKRLMMANEAGNIQASIRLEQLTMRRNNGENMVQGTPAYIAPEMAMAPESADCRADLYALGITAYQLLAGVLPFDGDDPLKVIMKHVTQEAPPLRTYNTHVSEKLEGVIKKLMAKKPIDRYQSSAELQFALERVH